MKSAHEPAVEATKDRVGRWGDDSVVTAVNPILTPYGRQVEPTGLRPSGHALSPNKDQHQLPTRSC